MRRLFVILSFMVWCRCLYAQQDVEFQVSGAFLQGKEIIKVKRDFFDPYVWVLSQNNEVYRINSITSQVEDLTANFSAYSHDSFIDIAGLNKDTVFLATATGAVVQYKSGGLKTIGAAEGILSAANSIGIKKNTYYDFFYFDAGAPPVLIVGSDKGLYFYDIRAEKATHPEGEHSSLVYEATYRTEMYRDSTAGASEYDGLKQLPVTFRGEYATFMGFLWEGGNGYGYNIKTACMISPSMYVYDAVTSRMEMFWGNSNGLFQNNFNQSYYVHSPVAHYLNGIQVNKVTNIYGLAAFGEGEWFGDPGMIKQNLLVGTDRGLYFSNSIYTRTSVGLRPFELFHLDALGMAKVNDICVNVASMHVPLCEDGAWVATGTGLYFLKPDYAKFVGQGSFQAASFKGAPGMQHKLSICSGEQAILAVDPKHYTGSSIQWYRGNEQLIGESHAELVTSIPGNYHAVLYDPCQNSHLETNSLELSVVSSPVFSFNYPDNLSYCDSASAALNTDYSPAYRYRWWRDGQLTGDTEFKMTATQSGVYHVEVSACSGSWLPSKDVKLELINLPVPQLHTGALINCEGMPVTINLNVPVSSGYTIHWLLDGYEIDSFANRSSVQIDKAGSYKVLLSATGQRCTKESEPLVIQFIKSPVVNLDKAGEIIICEGESVKLSATNNPAYRYRWYLNGVLTGEDVSDINVSSPGEYYVEASSCPGTWVPSSKVSLKVIEMPRLLIKTIKQAYCIGEAARLFLGGGLAGNYNISWRRDGLDLPELKGKTEITTLLPGTYQVIAISKERPQCNTVSPPYSLVFYEVPTVHISQKINTSLCSGEEVSLSVSYAGGYINWSTGETTPRITVNNSGLYKVKVTSATGCAAEDSIKIKMLPAPVFHVPDTSVCTYTKSTVVLTAPAGFRRYFWNNIQGSSGYAIREPQSILLTVEDENGCQASQQIVVSSACADVNLANAFTPNGDLANDTWRISGIENDPSAVVRIYNRQGAEVFYSKGYYTPWDGKFRGRALPAGTYYYIVTAKKGKQRFSGPVTIFY
ncbi:gliding motility-associated C-terminal domain-containing protein [Mucilaginibacter pedocola]|uniref:Ig-like domain-containing protein n=1 Tax=Mucilaginibacter pedocola TaxID=1792845 RepID=A0A1S9PBF6_9SPHI|nr:gliding motility-associated C-terminal domain-containing protein [Mucilaginibacter pedocola]OOQ58314.1 hypothetical protein BC343_11815 [Mucilaginibacter pedocola]